MFFSRFASMGGIFRRTSGRVAAAAMMTLMTLLVLAAGTGINLGVTGPVQARSSAQMGDNLATVSLAALPREAQETQKLILAGGPFPYSKDGTVFGNREQMLPRRPRGQYREYTVKTPGARNRGARRIVCAGEQVKAPEVCFYTADHYNTFSRIER